MTSWQGAMLESIANELKNIREILEKQSTTEQTSEVGEWNFKSITNKSHVTGQCSHCKERRVLDNYCPNCGAKMKGTDE